MKALATLRARTRPTLHVGRRFVLMLGGEAMQSLFGFGLSVGMARTLSARDYGVFSIIILMGGISLTYMRALAGVPAAGMIPRSHDPRRVAALLLTFDTASVGVAAGLGIMACVLLAAWLRGSHDAAPLVIWGAAYVAAWSLRSFVRNVALIERRVGVALAGDLAFTASGAGLAVSLAFAFGVDLVGVLSALTAASLCSIGIMLAVQRKWPRFSLRRPVVRRYLALWPGLGWSAAGITTSNVQAQGQAALVALLAGPAAYAPIAAALTLLAPLRLAAAALVNLIQPDLSAALHRSAFRIGTMMFWSTAALGVLGLLYGALLLTSLPLLQHAVFAGRFDAEPMRLIVALVLAVSLVFLLYAPPRTLLESMGAFRRLAEIAGLGAAAGLPAVAALLVWSTPAWSLGGLLLSEVVVLAASWFVVAQVTRRIKREGADG